MGLPPFLLRTNVTGIEMYQPLSAFTVVTGVLVLLSWRRSPPRSAAPGWPSAGWR